MANPATTTRQTPAGIKLRRGGPGVKIAFERDPDVSFWEIEVKPPMVEGGDAIDNTTQHNVTWRTSDSRKLMTLGEVTGRCCYDPNVYNNIISNLINQNGSITVLFPDGSTLDFFGFLKTFDPQGLTEEGLAEANFTVVPTNYDPDNDVEAGPVLTSVSGT